MKLTRILPKKMAIAWQEHNLNSLESKFEYHSTMARGFGQLLSEARDKLERLKSE